MLLPTRLLPLLSSARDLTTMTLVDRCSCNAAVAALECCVSAGAPADAVLPLGVFAQGAPCVVRSKEVLLLFFDNRQLIAPLGLFFVHSALCQGGALGG